MSFKSELKKFGLGSRGPYGRMQSGGERLSNTLGDWAGEKRESGWNQALIAASGEGKPITPEQQIEIADMWKVPLGQVMDSAQRINAPLKDKQVKNFAKSFYMRLEDVVKEGRKPDEKQIQQMIKDSGGNELDGMEARTIAMHVMQTTLPTLKEEPIIKLAEGGEAYQGKNLKGELIRVAKNERDVKKTDTRTKEQKNYAMSKKDPEFKKFLDRNKKDSTPEFYGESLKNAFEAINKDGADPRVVYNKMIEAYPTMAKELKAVILDVATLPPEVQKELQESVEMINAGKADINKERTRLSAKYVAHRKIFNEILKQYTTDETLQAIANLFNR